MAKQALVIDTNLYIEFMLLFDNIKKNTKKEYKEIWETLKDTPIEKLLTEIDPKKYETSIKFINRLLEMEKEQIMKIAQYEIHVPSSLYTEVGYRFSSKIDKDKKKKTSDNIDRFESFLNSLPFATVVDRTELYEGIDFPRNDDAKDTRPVIEELINKAKEENEYMKDLLQHLKETSKNGEKKNDIQNKVDRMEKSAKDVRDKYKYWDSVIKTYIKKYTSKCILLNSTCTKIHYFKRVDEDLFKPGSDMVKVIADRLYMNKQEFDYFDLQIYLYAKKKEAIILTMNIQAFQEIKDTHFLGYLDEVKIMHTLVNFDSSADLRAEEDLVSTLRKSIRDDFDKDVEELGNLHEKFRIPVKKAIEDIKTVYEKHLQKIDNRGGSDFKEIVDKNPLCKIFNKLVVVDDKVKLSKKSLFSDDKTNVIPQVTLIDKMFFDGNLDYSDFIQDADYTKKPPVEITTYLKDDLLKKKLKNFITDKEANLKEFIKYKRTEPLARGFAKALYIESHYEEKTLNLYLLNVPTGSLKPLPPSECPSSAVLSPRQKRGESGCVLDWDDIKEVSSREVTNYKEVEIDSDKFLDYINKIKDTTKRAQLIEFADEIVKSGENKLKGSSISEFTHLVNHHKVAEHFRKINRVSSAVNHGFIAKDIVADFLNGDLEGVAMDVGMVLGNIGLGKVSEKLISRGIKLAEEGSIMAGKTLKVAAPFIGRLASGFVIYDLYNQIKALKNGDRDAIAYIVGDSIFLIVDTVEVAIGVMELAGFIAGASSITGPIGMAIAAVVIVGTEVYTAVRSVDKTDDLIHLTTRERWMVGFFEFFGQGLPRDLSDLVELKKFNNELAQQAVDFLHGSDDFKYYVLPSAILYSQNKAVMAPDNEFRPNSDTIQWDRARPDHPAGGKVICANNGNWETLPFIPQYECVHAMALLDIQYPKREFYTKSTALFNFGEGTDTIVGFQYVNNFIIVGGGRKNFEGNDKDDTFIFQNYMNIRNITTGKLDGKGGHNSLDFSGFVSDVLEIDFQFENEIKFSLNTIGSKSLEKQSLEIVNINGFIGRKNQTDIVMGGCGTKLINGLGGTEKDKDLISFPKATNDCDHDTVIYLNDHTILENQSNLGTFSYFINDVHSDIKASISLVNDIDKDKQSKYNSLHNIFMNTTLNDINDIVLQHNKDNFYDFEINFHFVNEKGVSSEILFNIRNGLEDEEAKGRFDQIKFFLQDDTEMRLHQDGLFGLLKTRLNASEVIEKFRPANSRLGISLFIQSDKGLSSVAMGVNNKDDVLHNDPYNPTYLIGNTGNNVYTVRSGRDLTYDENSNLPEITIYLTDDHNSTNTLDLRPLSRQIKHDLERELIIKHKYSSNELIISTYIGRRTSRFGFTGKYRDWSFYEVNTIRIINDEKVSDWNSWCSRLHVIFDKAPVTPNCTAGYSNNPYPAHYEEDGYHLFNEDSSFLDYVQPLLSVYYPTYIPVPLVFEGYEIILIKEQDFEPFTKIIIHNILGIFKIARHKDDLVMTNSFDSQSTQYQPTTVILKDFYGNINLFYTLDLQFTDETILLRQMHDEISKVNSISDMLYDYHFEAVSIKNKQYSRVPRSLDSKECYNFTTSSASMATPLLGSFFIGATIDSMVRYCHKPFGYLKDYLKSIMGHPTSSNFKLFHEAIVDKQSSFPNIRRINNETKGQNSYLSQISPDINSTLFLLDVITRKINDKKYNLPKGAYLISPEEALENKVELLINNLELDVNDVAESLEDKYKELLTKIKPDFF